MEYGSTRYIRGNLGEIGEKHRQLVKEFLSKVLEEL